jgi:hypothetical protein
MVLTMIYLASPVEQCLLLMDMLHLTTFLAYVWKCCWVCIVYHMIAISCDWALIAAGFTFQERCFQVTQTTDSCLLPLIYKPLIVVCFLLSTYRGIWGLCPFVVVLDMRIKPLVQWLYASAFASCCYQLLSFAVCFVMWCASPENRFVYIFLIVPLLLLVICAIIPRYL